MNTLDQQLQQASRAIVRGQLDYAGRLLDKLRQTHPSSTQVWLFSAAWYKAMHDTQPALDSLAQAATMSLADPAQRNQVVDAYLSMQAWPEALQLLNQMNPKGDLLGISMARCEWGMGDYQASLVRLQQFVSHNPYHAEARLALWQCLERLGLFAQSDEQRKTCQIWAGQDPVTSLMENTFLVAEGQWSEAATLISSCSQHIQKAHPGLQRASKLLEQLQHPDTAPESTAQPKTNISPTLDQTLEQAHLQSLLWLQTHHQTNYFASSARLLAHSVKLANQRFSTDDWYLEFGVGKGRSLNILAQSEYANDRRWDGFDSFTNYRSEEDPMDDNSTAVQPPKMPANVNLHCGWFTETIPSFISQANSNASIAFMHIDCNLYRSAKTVFDLLHTYCRAGTVIQFDKLIGFPNYQQCEWQAWQEFLLRWPAGYTLLGSVFMGKAVAIQLN